MIMGRGGRKSSSHCEFFLQVLGQEHPGSLEVELLSLKRSSDLVITHDRSCEKREMKASSPMQRDGLWVPISWAKWGPYMLYLWYARCLSSCFISHFKNIKTFILDTSVQAQSYFKCPLLRSTKVCRKACLYGPRGALFSSTFFVLWQDHKCCSQRS